MKYLYTFSIVSFLCFCSFSVFAKPEVDPSIQNIRSQARKNEARMQVIKKTIVKPGQGTNIVARTARQSMQEKLNESRKEAKKAEKVEKAAQKANQKDRKNLEKLIKDIEKAKGKSSESMTELYDALLELIDGAIQ